MSTSSSSMNKYSNPWGLCCPKRAICPLPQTTVTRCPDAYICISPMARRYVRNFIQYSLLLFVIMILILWIGMEIQEYQTIRAADTLSFYSGQQVCGLSYPTPTTAATGLYASVNSSDSNSNSATELLWTEDVTSSSPTFFKIQTFPSVENATSNNSNNNNTDPTTTTIIAHCGDCGQCSNPQDVAIYDNTKNTLLETTIYCAKRALIWGRKTTSKCMQEMVGLTTACNECWVENIMCDLRYCVFICFWHAIFSQLVSGEDDSTQQATALNRCTLCDEKRCGPQFITCAGVNRRRSGILSDIERNEHAEVCRSVEPPLWWKSETLQELWKRQEEAGAGTGASSTTSSTSTSSSSNGTTGSSSNMAGGGGDDDNDGPLRTRLLRR